MSSSYYESALLRLRRVVSYLNMLYDEALNDEQLTPVQFEVLLFVDSQEFCSVSDVADFMVVDKSTSSRVLRGMEDKALITVTTDEADRRRKKVGLTPLGKTLMLDSSKKWFETEKAVRQRFNASIETLEKD